MPVIDLVQLEGLIAERERATLERPRHRPARLVADTGLGVIARAILDRLMRRRHAPVPVSARS
jgi:hypothetical protein